MSPEDQPAQQEAVVEKLPTLEDVKAMFAAILEGKSARVLRVEETEEGVYFYEVEVALESGETNRYLFQKDFIYVALLDSDGTECSGENVAQYVNGIWIRA